MKVMTGTRLEADGVTQAWGSRYEVLVDQLHQTLRPAENVRMSLMANSLDENSSRSQKPWNVERCSRSIKIEYPGNPT